MGFLDSLESETHALELANQSAKQRAEEKARNQMVQDEHNYRRALEYYQQSGCDRYVLALTRHLASLGKYQSISGEPSREYGGVKTRVEWSDKEYKYYVDVAVSSDGTVAVWGADGVTNNHPRIPLSEWQADPSRIDVAFEHAYKRPGRVSHEQLQRWWREQHRNRVRMPTNPYADLPDETLNG